MGFFYENKGVISIFLIIIMLPLLTSAVLLVDGTRYQSAKTMAQEAGDLAAYSTIANYNMDLKDEFGLFAMADQDVTAEFRKYLTETLGYSVDEAESYSQKVQDLISSSVFGGGSYKDADFFNMYNFKVENATATPLYPLSDPAVLQNQIVEYSKYRGVETILERFEILSKFDKVDEETKEAQETMSAIENLSAIEESYVTTVSRGVADLKVKTDEYNKSLSEIFGLMNTFYDCAEKEISAFAVKDSSISDKKQARIDAYNDVLATLDELETAAAEINTKAANLSADAQKAKEKLESEGISVNVIKLCRIKPIDCKAVKLASDCEMIFFFEESLVAGGIGESFGYELKKTGKSFFYKIHGIKDTFVRHETVEEALNELKLDDEGMIEVIKEYL